MSEIIHRQFERVERTEGDVKRVLFVASTATPDRASDIVDQLTWRLDNYRSNPVVQVDHEYSASATIGRGEVTVVDGVLTLEIVKWSAKPRAQEVKADVDDGIVNAVSVGFRPGRMIPRSQLPDGDPRKGDRGYVYYDCELLEVSVVAIPMNPEALAAKSIASADIVDKILADERLMAELVARLTLSGAPAPQTEPLGFPEAPSDTPTLGFAS
jgi:hypothetical protein